MQLIDRPSLIANRASQVSFKIVGEWSPSSVTRLLAFFDGGSHLAKLRHSGRSL